MKDIRGRLSVDEFPEAKPESTDAFRLSLTSGEDGSDWTVECILSRDGGLRSPGAVQGNVVDNTAQTTAGERSKCEEERDRRLSERFTAAVVRE